MQLRSDRSRQYFLFLGFAFVLSLWIRMAFPINAVAYATHDDLLFVQQAASIGQGRWLDTYNNLTLAKGMFYSLFLLVNQGTGLPLKFTEHALYLGVGLFFSLTVGRLYRSRSATCLTFVLLAFLPAVWYPGTGGRVIRESIYVTLSLLILTLGIRCWVLEVLPVSPVSCLRKKWPELLLLGLSTGAFWLTREEGVWLLPAMAVMASYWLWTQRGMFGAWRSLVAFLALPALVAASVVGAVNTVNYAYYGVFRNNDFRSSDFQSGYGALTRIRHDVWRRYVLFPRDARERAYGMSASARELQPFFEGAGGENWRKIGCEQTATAPCPEILSGWFMWALRDAVAQAGYYRDASTAEGFYTRLAAEIDAGCRQQPGDCLPARQTMLPPWQPSYALDTLKAVRNIFHTLTNLDWPQLSIGQSYGGSMQLALFETVTNGPLAPVISQDTVDGITAAGSQRDTVRRTVAYSIAKAERHILTLGLPIALLAWLLWSGVALVRRHLDAPLVVATALSAALVTRLVLLAFLEATSIPSNNMLYLFPAIPMALALLPVVLWGILKLLRPSESGRVSAASN